MLRLHEAQSVLDEWGTGSTPASRNRLASAIASLTSRTAVGSSDLAVLLRQVLRSDDAARREAAQIHADQWAGSWLRVPKCHPSTSLIDWGAFGLVVLDEDANAFRVGADPWSPRWLQANGDEPADHDVAAEHLCRGDESVPGDPFLRIIDLSITRYKTPGQRSAVRSALILPDGATLVVNLPTGAGKTLAMLAAAESAASGMTSILVVPTVALALDHERRYAVQHPDAPPSAYHGGLSPEAKAAFRQRLHQGEQRVIFTNPEAVVTSLARPLANAARGGRLALVAIDEAHVVGSWGDGFRPHFHSLAGLRTHLLREAAEQGHTQFKTILATATLTEDTLSLLQALFGEPGPFLQVAAPVVRAEPSYWRATRLDASTRDARLIETLRHIPRPAIVYTTLRQEQNAPPGVLTPRRAGSLLQAAGFSRWAVVDGESSTEHRERVLRGLRQEPDSAAEFDLVVATSAFGLGIDVPDIRAVVHACIPENLDRYYQEVGRGGRDGRASLSIVISSTEDERVADRLASPTYLTPERARERWEAMLDARVHLEGDTYRLPLTAVSGSVKQNSEYNEKWNLLTISLMARADAVKWDFSFVADSADDDSPPDQRGWMTVRLARGDHSRDDFWETTFEPVREAMVDRSRVGLTHLRRALSGDACTGVMISDSYDISNSDGLSTRCLASCGGCSWCRRTGRERWSSPSPSPAAIAPIGTSPVPLDRLAVKGEFGRRLIVCADADRLRRPRNIRALLTLLLSAARISLVVAPDDQIEKVASSLPPPETLARAVMVDRLSDYDPVTAVGVPTLILLGPSEDADEWLPGSSRAPLTVLCGAPDLPVAGATQRLIEQDGAYGLADIEKLL